MVSKQEVEAAYWLVLGRRAEEGDVAHWMTHADNTLDLLGKFLAAEEFRHHRLPQLINSGFALASHQSAENDRSATPPPPSMRAAIHAGIRSVGLVELERPSAVAGTIVVKIGAAGICGSDLAVYRTVDQKMTLPRGHEYSGVVVEKGDDVDSVAIGQRVTVDIFLESACGKCVFCRKGYPRHCTMRGRVTEGGFAEYVRVNAAAAFPLPDSVDDALGALTEPLAVAVHVVRKMAISRGMSGVVIGAGTIGLMAVAAAVDAGAERVYVVARHPFQAEAALALGATDILPAGHADALATVLAESKYGVDFAIEAVGDRAATLDEACHYVRPLGTVGVLGAFASGYSGLQPFVPSVKEQNIVFSNCYGYLNGIHDFEVAIELLSRKGGAIRKSITHAFALSEISAAFRVADNKDFKSIKVQVKP